MFLVSTQDPIQLLTMRFFTAIALIFLTSLALSTADATNAKVSYVYLLERERPSNMKPI